MNKRKSTRVEDKMEYVVNEDEIRAPTGGCRGSIQVAVEIKSRV